MEILMKMSRLHNWWQTQDRIPGIARPQAGAMKARKPLLKEREVPSSWMAERWGRLHSRLQGGEWHLPHGQHRQHIRASNWETPLLRCKAKGWDLTLKMGKVMITEKPPCTARVPKRSPWASKCLSSPPPEMPESTQGGGVYFGKSVPGHPGHAPYSRVPLWCLLYQALS